MHLVIRLNNHKISPYADNNQQCSDFNALRFQKVIVNSISNHIKNFQSDCSCVLVIAWLAVLLLFVQCMDSSVEPSDSKSSLHEKRFVTNSLI